MVKDRKAIIGICLLLSLIGIGLLIWGGYSLSIYLQRKETYVKSYAVVVDYDVEGGFYDGYFDEDETYAPIIEYVVKGKLYRKKLNELNYKIMYRTSSADSRKIEILHDPACYEVVCENKSVTQIYSVHPKEEIHFYVSSDFIEEGIVTSSSLHVRTGADKNAPGFMMLPHGARIQRIPNPAIPHPWIEIKFPTNEIYFVIE